MVATKSPAEIEPISDGDIQAVQREFHNLSGLHVAPEIVSTMGDLMCRSANLDDLIDSGWAFVQAGLEARSETYINRAQQICKRVVKQACGSAEEIKARMPLAIAPEYSKIIRGEKPDAATLARRLYVLNARVLSMQRLDFSASSAGGSEVAALYLLNRYIADNPDELAGHLAWPAFPWQDNPTGNSRANFSIMLGPNPDTGQRIKVRNLVIPSRLRPVFGEDGSEAALEYWRDHYDLDTTLIFGDVHLCNAQNRPFGINNAIHNQEQAHNKQVIRLATQNILDEIG